MNASEQRRVQAGSEFETNGGVAVEHRETDSGSQDGTRKGHGGEERSRDTASPNAGNSPPRGSDPGKSESGLRSFIREHRRALLVLLVMGFATIFVFAVLPQIAGFGKSLHKLRHGNKSWLAAGIGFECISLFGYMALLRLVFSTEGVRLSLRSGYQITMAGAVATKLLSAGGAGGIALTVWALRAAGLSAKTVARRMTSFELILYSIFMGSLVLFGGGLAIGLFPGRSPTALTVLPALFGGLVIVLAVGMGLSADRAHRWLTGLAKRATHGKSLLEKLTTVPRTIHGGARATMELLRRPKPGLLGALIYWAFDIGALWAGFKAFGASPPIAFIVLAYFVGQLVNVVPLPGGVGGVEGGMIGVFIAFGVSGSTAVLAVLAYSIISFWLPILPGTVAYLRLRSSVSLWREENHEAEADESSTLPTGETAATLTR